jgi:hypothetical protein
VFHVAFGGQNVEAAFEQLRREYCRPEMTGAVGVWFNHALIGRVVPIHYVETAALNCFLQELSP